MNIKSIKCYIKAIFGFFEHGVYIPHVFRDEEKTKGIIIATDNSFRISDNYEHAKNEKVYKNALIIKSRCICCGKEDISWWNLDKGNYKE